MKYSKQPLHPAQWEVFTDQLINPDSPHYNVGGYIRLEGELNLDCFQLAVQLGPTHFDVFKMRFDTNLSEPCCYLQEDFESMEMDLLDLSQMADPEAEGYRWMQEEFNTPFVIARDNLLFKQTLIKISAGEHWYFAKYHHLIIDGYGFIVWTQYLAQKYQSLLLSNETQISYPRYAEEAIKAIEYTRSQAYEAEAVYWKEKITGKPGKILQKQYLVGNSTVKASSTYVLSLDQSQNDLLKDIQVTTKTGLQQLTIAALLIYLGKSLGEKDFTFGVPIHKRGSRQLRNTLGMFAGMILFRGSYQQDATLMEFIKEVTQIQKKDYRHQHYLIGDLSRHLKIDSTEGYLFEISINYELFNFAVNFGDRIDAKVLHLSTEHEPIPLQLCWQDYGPQQPLALHCHYRHDYFTGEEVKLFAERIIGILQQFPEALGKKLYEIDILPEREKLLIREFNGMHAASVPDKSIIDLFQDQVNLAPAKLALVFEGIELTFDDLNRRSNQLAHYLRSRGIKEDVLVPVCIERSIEMIVAIIGILKAGGAYVPVDPSYPGDRINYLLQDTRSTIVISSRTSKHKLPVNNNIEIIELGGDSSLLDTQSVANLHVPVKEEQLAYVIYTSGSTGNPKGVMIEHRTLKNYLLNSKTKYVNERSIYSGTFIHLAFTFDASVTGIFQPLLFGKSIVISSKEGADIFTDPNFRKFAPYDFIKLTPSHLLLLEAATIDFEGNAIAEKLVVGGEALHFSHCEFLSKRKAGVEVINEYGPTEATVGCSTYNFSPSEKFDNNSHGISIGKPIDNVQMYILNEHLESLPVGTPGEIYIGGNGLARGYLNRPDLTAEKFISNSFDKMSGARLYKTGDLGRWGSDGNIEYMGRLDDQVKIRGFRVELGEIETVLEQCDLVRQAVVIAKNDKQFNKEVVAYIVSEEAFNQQAVKTFLRERLPEYMIPSVWVEMNDFPLTLNGKIDKKGLPDPNFNRSQNNEYTAPRNELETTLASIWQEILGVEKVGIYDNFFELGGHSLRAMQLISRLHKLLNVKTTISKVLSNPTISELAQTLGPDLMENYKEIPRLEEQDHYELAHTQRRIWVVSYFQNGSTMYNVPGAYSINGQLEVNAFKKAVDIVIQRHEILRTVFIQIEDEPRQKVLTHRELPFRIGEVEMISEKDSMAVIQKWLDDDFSKPFDLSNGPLLRMTLFNTEPGRYILGFNIHHIISDGWSKGILIKEILHCYHKLVNNLPVNLPPLPIQYRDYAAWHANSFAPQKDYWVSVYGTNIPVLNFPVDFERPKILSFDGAIVQLRVKEDLTAGLRKLAVDHGTTLNNLMFALYGILLAKHTRQDDVVIGSLVSGRNHADLENLVGLFINFLPIRLFPRSGYSLSEYLKNSYESLGEAYNNQDYPFDLMVDNLLKKRDFSRNPFFDTMVNFHSENNRDENKIASGDNSLELVPLDLSRKNFFQSVLDFKLDVELNQASLVLNLSYNAGLFTKARMESFLNDYLDILSTAVVDQDIQINDLLSVPLSSQPVSVPEQAVAPSTEVGMSVIICSSFVAEPLQEYIDYWSEELGIKLQLAFTPYNQVFQQLLDPLSDLRNNAGLNILFVRVEDWLHDHKNKSEQEQIEIVRRTCQEFLRALEQAQESNVTPYLIAVVPLQPAHSFSKDVANAVNETILELEASFRQLARIYLIDFNKVCALYEVEEIFDPKSDELGHIPFTQELYAALGTFIMRKIRAYKGPAYKVIALDCDNTLWKGVCGEVGALNVIIDENFTDLQQFILQKYNEGFLIALCSKNNEQDVWEVFDNHPGMKLKREHIAAFQVNWNPKPTNLAAIANELNLGLNSLIFIDDSEFEIEQTTLGCPDVLSLQLPQEEPGSFLSFLNHIWALDHFQITDEDTKRNSMYRAEKQRKEEQVKFVSIDEFLESLNIKVEIRALEERDLDRAVQLTLRTNQFNLNGIRKTPEEIVGLLRRKDTLNWIIQIKDRFGDYGTAGLLLATKSQNGLIVETFLLSCRVLGRKVEQTIINELRSYCLANGILSVSARYEQTSKNKPITDFLMSSDWEADPKTNIYNLRLKVSQSKRLLNETQSS
ncbi:amino acid adenylation domain-containing protein [Flavitalea antarctica]